MRLHVPDESRASREHRVDHHQHDRQGEPPASLSVKVASEIFVRFFLVMLDAWRRSDVKVLLRFYQEVTLILILRELQAKRQLRTLMERSLVGSHATMGATERANRTLEKMLRIMKHATEVRVGDRLETDHHLVRWMMRHSCWIYLQVSRTS